MYLIPYLPTQVRIVCTVRTYLVEEQYVDTYSGTVGIGRSSNFYGSGRTKKSDMLYQHHGAAVGISPFITLSVCVC